MAVKYVSGDLFVNRVGAEAFAHGCNLQGSMGAGIAKGFKERYPEMYEEYRRRCLAEQHRFNLGDSFFWRAIDKPSVFNLGTQERYWRCRASYEAIRIAVKNMRGQADQMSIRSIAIPRVGTGYGGLSWKKVRVIIEEVFADWPGTLYVYEEYVPSQ